MMIRNEKVTTAGRGSAGLSVSAGCETELITASPTHNPASAGASAAAWNPGVEETGVGLPALICTTQREPRSSVTSSTLCHITPGAAADMTEPGTPSRTFHSCPAGKEVKLNGADSG